MNLYCIKFLKFTNNNNIEIKRENGWKNQPLYLLYKLWF